MTQTQELYKKLKIGGIVLIKGWPTVKTVRKLINQKKIKVLKAGYPSNSFDAQYKTFDINKDEEWSTYSDCAHFWIRYIKKEDHISFRIVIYDGELLDGSPKRTRWEAECTIAPSYLRHFKDAIEAKFNRHCKGLYYEYQEAKKRNDIALIGKELLELD